MVAKFDKLCYNKYVLSVNEKFYLMKGVDFFAIYSPAWTMDADHLSAHQQYLGMGRKYR